MPMASSRKAQSALCSRVISGVNGIRVKGTVACRSGSSEMMPDRPVSTTVNDMYAEKRDRPVWQDEKIGRWILGAVVLIAIAAGIWFWQKRHPAEPEAPAAAPPVAAEPKVKNPIIAPDDIDPNLSATEQVATL